METTENKNDPEMGVERTTGKRRNQVIALIVLVALGLVIFFAIQNVNNNHSYGQARTVCRELMEERTVGLNTISWTINTGGVPHHVKEDDGVYNLGVVVSDVWGNEETRSCIASYRSGNWSTFIL